MKLVAIVSLISIWWAAHAQPQGAMTLCGRRLSTARELVCYGEDVLKQKRGFAHGTSRYKNLGEPSWSTEQWAWRERRAALGARWTRHKRGLVDECCLKPCTVSEILSYC